MNKTNQETKNQISTKEAYEITMIEIDSLMKKGEENLSDYEVHRLNSLAEAAEDYENTHDPLTFPASLSKKTE